MARRRVKTTRLDIIRYATSAFLEQGYSASSTKHIAEDLDIGTGNLTYYFPTKEHLLAVLVDMLCDFQWKLMEKHADDGLSSIMAICLELASMASACEQDAVIRDFFISAYTSPMCLEIIRRNDTARAMKVFASHRPEWTREQFAEAEILCSGIEYATLMPAGDPVPLETRVSGALNNILGIYNIPKDLRDAKIQRVFSLDYRRLGKQTLTEFRQFVEETNEHALEELYRARERNH